MLHAFSDPQEAPTSQFEKGKSGNPAGRPRGSRNKATLLMEHLLEDQAEQLVKKVISTALEGDAQALRLCIERLIPRLKERPIDFEMPAIGNYQELFEAIRQVFEAIGYGQITPTEGEKLINILQFQFQAAVGVDLEIRLEALERQLFPTKEEAMAKENPANGKPDMSFTTMHSEVREDNATSSEEKTRQDGGTTDGSS